MLDQPRRPPGEKEGNDVFLRIKLWTEKGHTEVFFFESNHDDLYDNDGDDFGENHGVVEEAEKSPVCLHMCTAWNWF
jgi:hypothetical protein